MRCFQSKHARGEKASAAVTLCHDRSSLLAEAIARRYALADAHCAYAASLSATGVALHDFLRAVQDATPPLPELGAGDALRLPAPPEEDDADAVPPPAMKALLLAPASSDSKDGDGDHLHLALPSDEDEASGDSGEHTKSLSSDDEAVPPLPRPEPLQPVSPLAPLPPQTPPPQPLQMVPLASYVSAYSSPSRPGYPQHYNSGYPAPSYSYSSIPSSTYGYGGGYGAAIDDYGQNSHSYNISYAQSQPPPPYVSYVQHPQATDATVQHYHYQGEAVSSSRFHYGGYYSSQYPQDGGSPPVWASSDQLPAPLPTPSPPRVSPWDFLDPFQAVESYYQDHPVAAPAAHAPSQSSSDAGEDEHIPELEDEESGVVVTDAHAGDECTCVNADEERRKSSASDSESLHKTSEEQHKKSMSSDGSGCSCALSEEETDGHIEIRSSGAIRSTGSTVVDGVEESVVEEVVEEEEQLDDSGVADEPPAVPEKKYSNDVEVVQEIKLQFDSASKSAGDVCKMLEVGKVPYYQKKNSGLKVPSMMICGQRSKGKTMQFEEENAMECGNLSSSLQKLYIWEKKLLKEVKIAEKMRVLYEQKHKEQKKMYYGGAEAHKLVAAQICAKKLSRKMNIAVQIVNNISIKINNLRDEELWPQTHELIKGFMQMWHTMSECHQMQCSALSHVKNIDSTMAAARFNEYHIDLIKQLELQLLDMATSFARWFNAQKSYATSMNEWLKKGIEHVSEVTDDGVPPFSPGRLGAPPIFSIYNNWAIIMERISETEVVGAMQALSSNILSLWEQHRLEWRKVVLDNSDDLDRDLRSLDMDDLLMRKEVEARSKKLVLVSNQRGVLSAQAAEVPPSEAGLQSCMSKVFEAMESFTTACEIAYKDLHLRAEEEKAQLDQEIA